MTQAQQDRFVKIMLVLFLSLISFSAGTFIGKEVADSDHRRIQLQQELEQEVDGAIKQFSPGDGK